VWRAGGGSDMMDGGAGTDTVEIIGDANTAESFVISDRATALADGYTALAANTEIVVIRNNEVIAELVDIEEIIVDVQGGGDRFAVKGNFSGTSLAFETITIRGSEGDDIVDISAHSSSHRIVFQSKGGNDQIIGTLRPNDVVLLKDGKSIEDYEITENPD